MQQGDGPEGFQRAIGKPFGRARRRETSAFGKAIVLNENSIRHTRHLQKTAPSISAGSGFSARRGNMKNPVLHTENGQKDYFFSSLVQWGQRVASSGISLRQ